MIILGTAAFLLMLLGDINDAFWRKKALRLCFPAGIAALAAATALGLDFSKADAAWCLVAAAFGLLLIYALFGSFSVNEAYVEQEHGRKVCDTGFYGACRHPGVLFFVAMYASLHFALGLSWREVIVYSALNLLLAAAEDVWIFPRVLGGYDEYKKRVPFIIPRLKKH